MKQTKLICKACKSEYFVYIQTIIYLRTMCQEIFLIHYFCLPGNSQLNLPALLLKTSQTDGSIYHNIIVHTI